MTKRIVFITVGVALGIWGAGFSQEHPEHPTSKQSASPSAAGSSKEHPNKEHSNMESQKTFQEDFEKFVKDYVASESQKTGGVFTIHDDKLNKDWKLSLVKVHKNRICMLAEGKQCFACSDFKEVGGKDKLDLDFYANHTPDGKMSMEKVIIHKLNGKPRFTYDKNNNMVPVK